MKMKTKETDVEEVRRKNNANLEIIADTRDVNKNRSVDSRFAIAMCKKIKVKEKCKLATVCLTPPELIDHLVCWTFHSSHLFSAFYLSLF